MVKNDLKYLPFSGTYLEKLQKPEALNIVSRNKKIIEPIYEFLDVTLFNSN